MNSACNSFHSHHQWKGILLAPNPHQHELSLKFLILAILEEERWNLKIILIGISIMAKDVDMYVSMYVCILGI